MIIKLLEIQNFRKLQSCRIELDKEKTVFIGANNSGKTSAMDALVKFLINRNKFSINDFTLSNWNVLNTIGEKWVNDNRLEELTIDKFRGILPALDIWISVSNDEIHYVTHLIPTLDWTGGLIGVRLLLEAKNIEILYKEYLLAYKAAKDTVPTCEDGDVKEKQLNLWPSNLCEYISKKIESQFVVNAYILDPLKLINADGAEDVTPQKLSENAEPYEGNPLKGLIRIDNINAQRGFSDPEVNIEDVENENSIERASRGKLSIQLRKYYNKHLDPMKLPDPEDIEALYAIKNAQDAFDQKLKQGFKDALEELESLGYPGVANPKISISTKINPLDGLKHNSAVQYAVLDDERSPKLPEQYNGLGYQNLISMVFKLMSFRDEWMQVGKEAKRNNMDLNDYFIPPLHLVFVEEPEAHLHAQVQQVFIRKAYDVLRNHKSLKEQKNFCTQLIVSTHSSHIAHEVSFANLRYFRRIPSQSTEKTPMTVVINLSDVFGEGTNTDKFVERYLKTTHCDLFFADAAILIEGSAERIMVPHFIKYHYPKLYQSYITLLEIGGSHAHRLRPLVEKLGMTCLIITDLDAGKADGHHKSAIPERNKGLVTNNSTLKTWIPEKMKIDELLDLSSQNKVKKYDNFFSIRVAYQAPIMLKLESKEEEFIFNTFEDALVCNNIQLFKNISETSGWIEEFKNAINSNTSVDELKKAFFDIIRGSSSKKAAFALDLLHATDPEKYNPPSYIEEGLDWLETEICIRQKEFDIDMGKLESTMMEEV
ncbi:AAA family ATPase [Clostridium magnum]|nr:AAA family ATPase [Clostridium magnum]